MQYCILIKRSCQTHHGNFSCVLCTITSVLVLTWHSVRIKSRPQNKLLLFSRNLSDFCVISPIPSIWHRLSYDDCAEDKREDYQNFCAALCNTVVHYHMHTDMNNSYRWTVLGFELLRFYWIRIIGVRVSFCIQCISSSLLFGCQYQCSRLPGKTHPQNDLLGLCVEWVVKPYTLVHFPEF